jgi:hypothetical protein
LFYKLFLNNTSHTFVFVKISIVEETGVDVVMVMIDEATEMRIMNINCVISTRIELKAAAVGSFSSLVFPFRRPARPPLCSLTFNCRYLVS